MPAVRTSLRLLAAGLLVFAALPAVAQVSLAALDTPYTQNFDSLPASGSVTWVDNSTIAGWYLTRTASGAGTNPPPAPPYAVTANDGSSNTGSFFSYGSSGAADRALGSVCSNTTRDQYYGVRLKNDTGAAVTSLEIAYSGEQWRNGGNADVQYLTFSYGIGTPTITDLTLATTAVAQLDFASPVTGASAATLNGNQNSIHKTYTITGLNIPAGTEIMLRWKDESDVGNDHGLAIDDVTVIPHGQGGGDPGTPTISIDSPSVLEGASGTTATLAFHVHLSAASVSDVTFDIATANGSATAGTDYVAKSLTNQSITAGLQDYGFEVTVIGNDAAEPDKTVLVNVTGISGATPTSLTGTGTILNDDGIAITKIHDVQGSVAGTVPGSANGCGSGNDSSPLCGQSVTVEAVVTATFPALSAGQLGGFYIQEETVDEDGDDTTSEGVFVYCPSCASIKEGDLVRVTGTVQEYFGLTEISAFPAGVSVVEGTVNHLSEVTPAHITLPIPAGVDVNAYYEAREGMLVQFDGELTVTEYFQLFRYGQIVLAAGERPRTFTEDHAPSVSGLAAHLDELARRRVILDDDRDGDEAALDLPAGHQYAYWPHTNGGFSLGEQGKDFFRGGDKIENLVGVLQWSRPGSIGSPANTWRVRPSNSFPVTFEPVNLRPATPPDVGGSIRAVGMNMLNYFTTIDTTSSSSSGPCGPSHTLDCRGADSQAELDRQTARAALVICSLNPDVAGLAELENNDVPSPTHTIDYLVSAVNAKCPSAHPYTYVTNTGGTLGTDAIRVGIIYRQGVLSPVGSSLFDNNSIHNRPPLAQAFDVVDVANPAFGKRFTVVANHLKSKGSCPASGVDADQGDGQSCWADTRRQQAIRTATWISDSVIPAAGSANVLLLGDFNSYASETAISELEGRGYHDLETELHGINAYSYLFDGEIGHLDYALASAALRGEVAGADAWHINADEVDLLDYNDEIKDVGEPTYDQKPDGSMLDPPRTLWNADLAVRASDHDPVVVGLFPVVPQGQLAIAPSPLDFGDEYVGTITLRKTVTLSNSGDAALQVTSLSAPAAPFARSGGTCGSTPFTLDPGGANSCTLIYTFTPAAEGEAVDALTIATDSGDATLTLRGNGVPRPADMADVRITEYMYQGGNGEFIEFTNVGATPVDLSGWSFSDKADVPGQVALGVFGDNTIRPGESVVLTETAAETFRSAWGLCGAAKIVGGNTTNIGRNDVIHLYDDQGRRVDRLAYGDQDFPGTFRTQNTSAWTEQEHLGQNDITQWQKSVAGTAGAVTSAAGDVGSPGRAYGFDACVGALTITPATVAFGEQTVGTTSAAQTVTLANTGAASLEVTALTAAAAPFARSGGSCPATLPITLAAGADCTLTYTFSPTTTEAAEQTLAVTTSAPGSGTIALSGTGVQGNLTITPATVAFGEQVVGTTSAAQTVTLANTGAASLEVTALTAAAAPFARNGGSCPAMLPITLAAGADCTLSYTFAPTAAGAAEQTLTVAANAPGSGTIALSGTGTLPQVADVAVTIGSDHDYAQLGDTLNYVITVANATGPATAAVTVTDALPAGLADGSWICTASGAATCGNGSGDTLNDVATLPAATQVTYVYSATVQADAPDTLVNDVTATVGGGVSDPDLANNGASDTVTIVIFRDGFEQDDSTLALAPFGDGHGFVGALLTIDRGLLDGVGIMPVAIAAGRASDGRTAFTLELARFGASHFLRLTTTDADGHVVRGEWQVARFEQPLDFAWQSATAERDDGYLRIVAGRAALQSTGGDSRRLVGLRIRIGAGATPWLSAQPQ